MYQHQDQPLTYRHANQRGTVDDSVQSLDRVLLFLNSKEFVAVKLLFYFYIMFFLKVSRYMEQIVILICASVSLALKRIRQKIESFNNQHAEITYSLLDHYTLKQGTDCFVF